MDNSLASLLGSLDQIEAQAEGSFSAIQSIEALEELRVSLLGKKGQFAELMRLLGSLSAHDKPGAGQRINEFFNALFQWGKAAFQQEHIDGKCHHSQFRRKTQSGKGISDNADKILP